MARGLLSVSDYDYKSKARFSFYHLNLVIDRYCVSGTVSSARTRPRSATNQLANPSCSNLTKRFALYGSSGRTRSRSTPL